MQRFKTFLFLVISALGFISNSQTDSLWQVIRTTQNDSIKAETLYYLTFQYVNSDVKKARETNRQAFEIAKKTNSDYAFARAFNAKGVIYDIEGKIDSAKICYNNALDFAEKSNSDLTKASVINNLGLLEWNKGSYDTALKYYNQSLGIFEKLGNLNGIANTQSNIGLIYYDLKNFAKAEEYTHKSLEIREKQKDKYGISVSYVNLAMIATDNKHYNQAIPYNLKALEYKKELQDERGMAMVYNNLTSLYLKINQPAQAIYYGEKSLKINTKIDSKLNLSYNYGILADAYILQKSFPKARDYIYKSIAMCDLIDNKPVMVENFTRLERIEKETGNFKSAYHYLQKKDSLSQLIFTIEKEKAVSEIESKYQDEKREKSLILQQEQIAKSKLVIKNNRLTIISLGLILLVLSVVAFAYMKRQQHIKKHLQREMQLKTSLQEIETQNRLQNERLRISRDLHDNIGSQLTFITSTLDNYQFKIKKNNPITTTQITDLELFAKNTIQELRDTIWALNQKEITSENTILRIQNFLDKAKNSFPDITFTLHHNSTNKQLFTSLQSINLLRAIQEAVNNALKHAQAQTLEIQWLETNNALQIQINDNGKGFDLHAISEGYGLANMQKRMDEIGAKFDIQSSEVGTQVRISLPISS